MKTSTFERKIPMMARVGVCLVALAGALVLGAGACNEAGQGDRCNPLRSSNECSGSLVCAGNPIGQSTTYPIPFCPENYCCPVNSDGTVDFANATSPYCQPGCNGGAASICAAMGSAPDAEACEFASCLADASDPTSCVSVEEGGTEGDGATSDGEVSDAESLDAAPSDAGSSDAAPSDAAPSEAAAEAATTPLDAGTDATDSSTD